MYIGKKIEYIDVMFMFIFIMCNKEKNFWVFFIFNFESQLHWLPSLKALAPLPRDTAFNLCPGHTKRIKTVSDVSLLSAQRVRFLGLASLSQTVFKN